MKKSFKWVEYTKQYNILKLYLFNKIITLELSKTVDYRCDLILKLGKFRSLEFRIIGDFDIKEVIDWGFFIKHSRVLISFMLFGIKFSIRLGHTGCYDNYDLHLDRYYDNIKKDGYKTIAYYDKELTKPVVFSQPRRQKYKEYFTSKWVKIFNEDWLNCPYGRAIEFALPFLYYLELVFYKPFDYKREWFGFNIKLNFKYVFYFTSDLMLFKHILTITTRKNNNHRYSNLLSCSAIDRYFSLKGNRYNKEDEAYKIGPILHPFFMLEEIGRFAQFKHLMKYMSLKEWLYWELPYVSYICNQDFHRGIFDFIYEKLIEYDFPVEKIDMFQEWDIEPYAKEKILKLCEIRKNKKEFGDEVDKK